MHLPTRQMITPLSKWILKSIIKERPLRIRCALATVFFGCSLIFDVVLFRVGGEQFSYGVFAAAVLSTLYAGPAIAAIGATACIVAVSFLFITPGFFSADPDRLIRIIVFVALVYLVGIVASALRDGLRQLTALNIEANEARKAAEREGAAREHTINIVSHDLRNPLASIQMYIELLSRDPTMIEKQGVALQTIRRSTERMNRIISDLLDAGRIDSGRFSIELKNEGVKELLTDTIDALKPIAAEKGVILETQIKTTTPAIVCDHNRMTQALSNIIQNAIKFSPKGGRVLVQVTDAPEGISFAVIDQGPGVPASEIPSLFKRYWRSPTQVEVEGTGLGLYIVNGIVESHGGTVAVKSEIGKGSSFSITLPKQVAVPHRIAA